MGKTTKRVLMLMATAVMAFSLAACGSQASTGSDEGSAQAQVTEEAVEATDGAYEVNSGDLSLDQNADAQAAFTKALETLDGSDYEPVALLGTQVVSGTNYAVLCRITPVTPDAEPEFGIVYIYEDLDGNAEVTEVKDLVL